MEKEFQYDVLIDNEKEIITIGTMDFSFKVIDILSKMNNNKTVEFMFYPAEKYFKFVKKNQMPNGY